MNLVVDVKALGANEEADDVVQSFYRGMHMHVILNECVSYWI